MALSLIHFCQGAVDLSAHVFILFEIPSGKERRFRFPPTYSSERPGRVGPDQGLVVLQCADQRGDILRSADVTQGNGRVPEQTASFGPLDGALPEPLGEFRLV